MTKLSVVVIIYKVEKYLRECIESILRQSFEDFELILVDDGSPDECPRICDEYAEKDFRIKVIHQENQGSVMARRNGLSVACGEYISFVDGDDWLDADMYEHMLNLADKNDSDIVVVGYKEGTKSTYVEKGNAIASGIYTEQKMWDIYSRALYVGEFYQPGIVPALWNKIFKRSLFEEDYILPNPIIKMGEDAAVSYPLIARAKSLAIDNEFYPYHYRVVEGSMSKAYDERYFERCQVLLEGINNNLIINPIMQEKLKYYALFLVEIGVLRVFSKEVPICFSKKILMIQKFQHQYKHLNIGEYYDWNKINSKNKKWLECFDAGKIYRMVMCLYIGKASDRLERIYGKEK